MRSELPGTPGGGLHAQVSSILFWDTMVNPRGLGFRGLGFRVLFWDTMAPSTE